MSNQRVLSLRKAIIIGMVYTILFLAYGYYSYTNERNDALAKIDKELIMGARSVPLLLPQGYHHRGLRRSTLSFSKDLANTYKLSDFIKQTNLSYIYSFILDEKGKIRFTSSSATQEELEGNQSDIYSFDVYEDEVLDDLFQNGELNKPVFTNATDKWGDFRSVYILLEGSKGFHYVVGADYDQFHLTTLKNTIMNKIIFLIIPLTIFILFYVIANYVVVQYLKANIRQKHRELKRAYEYDHLTQLPNKRRLMLTLQHQHRLHYIAVLDINKFSLINDIFGYEYGNHYIQHCAKTLHDNLSSGMRLYKADADLFVITYDAPVGTDKVESLFRELIKKVGKVKCHFGGYESLFEFSVGISTTSRENNPLTEAEIALKEAKKSRKSLIVFTPEMDQNIHNKNVLDDIAYAIENDKVYAYFQPIMDLENNEVHKYESLMRLEKRDGEIVAPWYFLELAKKTVSYEKLTMIMLDHVIAMAEQHPSEQFSINLSSLDIENAKLIQRLLETIVQAGVSEQIILEILESEEFDDIEALADFVHQCQYHGIGIAIDDFGSGFSNIANTIKLDIDYLKIDGSLILHILSDERYEKVVQNILSFAKDIGVLSIAEYVEDEMLAEKLKEMGVDMLQGYYIGRPSRELEFCKNC